MMSSKFKKMPSSSSALDLRRETKSTCHNGTSAATGWVVMHVEEVEEDDKEDDDDNELHDDDDDFKARDK